MVNFFKFLNARVKNKSQNKGDFNEPLLDFVNEKENEHDTREINQIVKDVEDELKSDQDIINHIEVLIIKRIDDKKKIRDLRNESDELSLLHLAAKHCRHQLCNYLIDIIRIDKDVCSKSKTTPFQLLLNNNCFPKGGVNRLNMCLNMDLDDKKDCFKQTFDLFISKGINYNFQDDNGYTSLHYATLKNNYEAVKKLLTLKYIDVNLEDKSNMTPLAIACEHGYDDIALLLIEKTKLESIINAKNNSLPLHLACSNIDEKLNIVKLILEKIANEHNMNPLLLSSYYPKDATSEDGFNSSLDEVLKKMNEKNQSLISILIDNNHLKIIELLLKDYNRYIVDIEDTYGNLLIHLAAKNGSPELLRLLIKYNGFSFRVNENYENGLHIAATNNKFNFIKEYLAYEKSYTERLNERSISNESESSETSTLKESFTPSVKCFNIDNKTPLFLAVINGHLKSVEVLITSEDVDLEAIDSEGNTIYHICGELNNFDSLRYMLTRKNEKYLRPLYVKNKNNDSVIHTACYYGNLEVVRLVLSKIYDGFSSTEAYLLSKNNEGYIGFHLACIKGFYNIVEYFLMDLKMKFFLNILDNDSNTCLHMASVYGHMSIVNLLIESGAEINPKNKDNYTPLEMSVIKGFFEISKVLISKFSSISAYYNAQKEYPLHVAAYEGSYEVVELLLSKGVPIDSLNAENKNCLDIAIERDQREVIKVLLENKNWQNLIELTSYEEFHPRSKSLFETFGFETSFFKPKSTRENPQLGTMFEKKMFDLILIILDNCNHNEEYFEFSKLDPPLKSIKNHPLMLMAQSGQETILKHPTVEKLLALKWRFLPRFAFYSNLLIYLFFIISFTLYSFELSKFITDLNEMSENNTLEAFNTSNKEIPDDPEFTSKYTGLLISSIGVNILKVIIQIILVDHLSYFTSTENLLELGTYALAIVSMTVEPFSEKLKYSSLTILMAFIVFTFLIQKLRLLGLYVLAFRRTLHNSLNFFPIFLLIFIGFLLSFRLQTEFVIANQNFTSAGTLLRSFVMTLGEMDTGEMGLEDNSLVNYAIYFLFISLICVILINLFVGIAVGEITTVLNEADVQQISMRIIFVLKVEETLNNFIHGPLTKKIFSLQFDNYNPGMDYKFIKAYHKTMKFLKGKFRSVEPTINLVDPQKRLEDNMIELSRSTNSDLKSIRENLTNQINEVEHKLANSQQRIEDYLIEMTCRTATDFEITKEDSSNSIGLVEEKLEKLAKGMFQNFYTLDNVLKYYFTAIKQSFKNLISNLESKAMLHFKKIEKKLDELNSLTKGNHKASNEEFELVKKALIHVSGHVDVLNEKLDKIMEKMNILQTNYDMQIEKDAKLENLLAETRSKIDQQKNILSELPKYQPKIIIDKGLSKQSSKDSKERSSNDSDGDDYVSEVLKAPEKLLQETTKLKYDTEEEDSDENSHL